MDLKWLFLRWLVIISLVAVAIGYLRSGGSSEDKPTRYTVVPLIRGDRSAGGMPLAGISVDPARRDVYAVVGRTAPAGKQPFDFFIVWKGADGKSHAAMFGGKSEPSVYLVEIDADGGVRPVQNLTEEDISNPVLNGDRAVEVASTLESHLRTIFEALPPELRDN